MFCTISSFYFVCLKLLQSKSVVCVTKTPSDYYSLELFLHYTCFNMKNAKS